VQGRSIVQDGRVLGIDYPAMRDDLLARLRATMSQSAGLASALGELEHAVTSHYQADKPCC
jgi:hypothetical protein